MVLNFSFIKSFTRKKIIIREMRNKQGKIGEETSDKLVSAEHVV